MVLGKFAKILLIVVDIFLFAFMINSLVQDFAPINKPVFWIAALIEIGLGWLTYRFWMRSILGREYRSYRFQAFILIIVGIMLPLVLYYTNIEFLRPAASTDIFYICTVITLLIYSSFIINRYVESHRKSLK